MTLILEAQNNIRIIEHNFYRNTVASRYNIKIPEGPLFYTCAGNDTIDSIPEFHFVDNRIVPRLPQLECGVSGYNEDYTHLQNYTHKNMMIPKEIVKGAIAFSPYDDNSRGKIYKQEWQLVKDDKKVEIYRHLQDGMETFRTLKNIAVFFLRRDSDGEGGSGQMWFQQSLFEDILDKLLDNGLIVTDGSSRDHRIYYSAEWKSLWANCDKRGQMNYEKPSDFIYYNRKFKCIGKCGEGYGPVYVWQVTKF